MTTPDVLTAELAQRAAERAAEYERRRAERARTRAALAAARARGLRARHAGKILPNRDLPANGAGQNRKEIR